MSGRGQSPSSRWSREHGGRTAYRRTGRYPVKRVHATWASAWYHCLSLALRDTLRGRPVVWRLPYPCRWGQYFWEGETAPVHWHVGRRGKVS